jgi:RNA-directed DNA polymerase
VFVCEEVRRPRGESLGSKPKMNEHGKSDNPVVPRKQPNKTVQTVAEAVEGRGLAGSNLPERTKFWTQCQTDLQNALERIRKAAKDKKQRFTTLFHHVYDVNRLHRAFLQLKRTAAAGVDGETWQHYGENLEENLHDLSERLKRGAYRAKPVRRVLIPKADGGQRSLGVPALEDKIVQSAMVEVLNAIYENDFIGFSYGFRPQRSQHQALDALTVALERKKVNWVLDADIRGFFDNLDHKRIIEFIEHRIADQRVIRHCKKWLNAGVLADGERIEQRVGAVQGGSISPLMANIYLHYVLDLWLNQWRKTRARGEVIVVRFADDFIIGLQYKDDAERLQIDLSERLAQFNLTLHPEKTRLIEFGRYADRNRRARGEGAPEVFHFLGFTHICGKRQKDGGFTIWRRTMRKKMHAKLAAVKQELRTRMHQPIPKQGRYITSLLLGHYRYYGVPGNQERMRRFRKAVGYQWLKSLRRRSQKAKMVGGRINQLYARWLPDPQICHPYPAQRFAL